RVSEKDVTGFIFEKELGYVSLVLPMEFDSARHCSTQVILRHDSTDGKLRAGEYFSDPRTYDGELLFPARFPKEVVERDKRILGPHAFVGQMQQSPVARGGNILQRDWWKLFPEGGETFGPDGRPSKPLELPVMNTVICSVDTAMSTRDSADYSALTIFG